MYVDQNTLPVKDRWYPHRLELFKGIKELQTAGILFKSWGNMSLCIREEDLLLITPSGIDYKRLTPAKLVPVSLSDERVLDEKLKPSSELYMHLYIYKSFNDINVVFHTHSPYVTAFAIAEAELLPISEELAEVVGKKVVCAEYGLAGSKRLAENVIKVFKQGYRAVFLSRHGFVVGACSVKEASLVCEVVERNCMLYLLAKSLSGGRDILPIPDEHLKLLRNMYLNSYSKLLEKQ